MPTTIRSKSPTKQARTPLDLGPVVVVLLLTVLFVNAWKVATAPAVALTAESAAIAAMQGGL